MERKKEKLNYLLWINEIKLINKDLFSKKQIKKLITLLF
jgi:hypothetical protein